MGLPPFHPYLAGNPENVNNATLSYILPKNTTSIFTMAKPALELPLPALFILASKGFYHFDNNYQNCSLGTRTN